ERKLRLAQPIPCGLREQFGGGRAATQLCRDLQPRELRDDVCHSRGLVQPQLLDDRTQSLPEAALCLQGGLVEKKRRIHAKDGRRPILDGVRTLYFALTRGDLHDGIVDAGVEVQVAQRTVEKAREVEQRAAAQRREPPRQDELSLGNIGRGKLRGIGRDLRRAVGQGPQTGSER